MNNVSVSKPWIKNTFNQSDIFFICFLYDVFLLEWLNIYLDFRYDLYIVREWLLL